jgi:hypothetical protein
MGPSDRRFLAVAGKPIMDDLIAELNALKDGLQALLVRL